MNIEFKKDEQGNETATISKADYEQALAEAKANATKEAKGNAVQGIEDKYGISLDAIKELKKEVRTLRHERNVDIIKQEYLAQGGKPEYFNDFYANNKFEGTSNLKEDMTKVKETKGIYFNPAKPFQSVSMPNALGINTEAQQEVLNDGKGQSLTEQLRQNK